MLEKTRYNATYRKQNMARIKLNQQHEEAYMQPLKEQEEAKLATCSSFFSSLLPP